MVYLPKTKISAASMHFFFSVILFSLFILTLRISWYPEPYFTASGGWQGLKIVAFVDLVLGPLLTFVVFNLSKTKKELAIDLGIIFILQIAVLIWGIYTVYNQRPIAITFWENSFYTIPYKAISQQYAGSKMLRTLTDNPRQFYITPKPTTVKEILQLSDEVVAKQLPPYQLIERYQPIEQQFDKIKNHSIDINEVISKNSAMKKKLMSLLKQLDLKISDNIYIPLISRYQNIILIFDKKGYLLATIKAPLKD